MGHWRKGDHGWKVEVQGDPKREIGTSTLSQLRTLNFQLVQFCAKTVLSKGNRWRRRELVPRAMRRSRCRYEFRTLSKHSPVRRHRSALSLTHVAVRIHRSTRIFVGPWRREDAGKTRGQVLSAQWGLHVGRTLKKKRSGLQKVSVTTHRSEISVMRRRRALRAEARWRRSSVHCGPSRNCASSYPCGVSSS